MLESKVIHVIPSVGLEDSGPTYSVKRLVETLSASRYPAELVALKWWGSEADSEMATFCSLDPYFPKKLGKSAAMYKFLSEKAACQPTVIHSHGMWQINSLYGSRVRRKFPSSRLVISPRGALLPYALSLNRYQKKCFWKLFQKAALDSADAYCVTSHEEMLAALDLGLKKPFALIGNGIDTPQKNIVRATREHKVLLYLGRIHPIKGLDRLLKAWSQLESSFPGWRLEIVGNDTSYYGSTGYLSYLKSLADQLSLRQVEFRDGLFGRDKWQKYGDADLFVLPSYSENFGVVVAEALSYGVPVLASKDIPWKSLDEKQLGWTFDDSNIVSTLHMAMSESNAERLARGDRGASWILSEYNWHKIAKMTIQLYDWLQGVGPQPPFVVKP